MIATGDLERLAAREPTDRQILSLFLDMSVNSDNKRTHQIFLNQKRAEFQELDSDRENHHREAIGEAFARVEQWIEDSFEEQNHGVVIYAELGGDGFEPYQFPIPIGNRLAIADRPVISPLAQVLHGYHHHGVVLLDREHVRILSIYLGTVLDEIEVHGDPYPAAHDVQAGGYSQQRYQRRKAEETKHFFREFAKEVEEFVQRYQPHDLVILGTEENVAHFKEFLSERALEMVIHTGSMRVDEPAPEVLSRLESHLERERERERQEAVDVLLDRAREDYLATGGFASTLSALQEGRVDTLVLATDLERTGSRCTQCGFVFARDLAECPYDGSAVEHDVDIVEEMVRIAEGQGIQVQFSPGEQLAPVRGVGALLRY